ncbi:MAG: GTP-binding protein [Steroidobacter sp.]
MSNKPVVPVNIVCGALGAGKTTAIAKLLTSKPAQESWVVILNEFTDTGLDTLTLAAAARGSYDVRMIPGGCLCCTGEEDFRTQLSSLLNNSVLPSRIIIEPSGIGHAGSIIEELRVFERSGAIKLHSVIVLIEPQRLQSLETLPAIARDQVESADVVLLSKAELADQDTRDRFTSWAGELFPAKRLIGFSEQGILPPDAMSPPDTPFRFSQSKRNSTHHHVHDMNVVVRDSVVGNFQSQARVHRYLNREACGWIIPDDAMFDLQLVERKLQCAAGLFVPVERFKAALRTGIDRWHLIQSWNDQLELREIAWRNDNRIEVQLMENATTDWAQWDEWINSMLIDG